jgi:hypothetical protein
LIRGDFEINAAIGGGVGVTALDEHLDHADLMRDVGDGAGLDVRGEEIQRGAVGVEFLRPEAGEVGQGLPGFLRVADRLVIHVSEIAHMQRGDAAHLHHAAEDILRHEGAEVPDVRRSIHGGAAAVEAQRLAIEWRQGAGLAGQSVVELEWHEGAHSAGG